MQNSRSNKAMSNILTTIQLFFILWLFCVQINLIMSHNLLCLSQTVVYWKCIVLFWYPQFSIFMKPKTFFAFVYRTGLIFHQKLDQTLVYGELCHKNGRIEKCLVAQNFFDIGVWQCEKHRVPFSGDISHNLHLDLFLQRMPMPLSLGFS